MNNKPETDCCKDIAADLREDARQIRRAREISMEPQPTLCGHFLDETFEAYAKRLDAVIASKSYALGQFDERAYNHGRNVVDEMREATGIKYGVAHFVCVAVYVDGFLQFAGADACLEKYGKPIDRLTAKNDAAIILGRMSPDGEISRGGAS
jgi:hypothetical protein